MGSNREMRDIVWIVKQLEKLLEDHLIDMPVKRNDEQTAMCRVLFSHNIRYLRAYLGFIARGSPYEQQEFAGLVTVSVAGLRRWENAEVIPNKAGLKNVVTFSNQLLQLPTLITDAHLLYCNLVTEIPLLRLGSHSADFQNLSYEERRKFSSFMTNNMDLMLSHFMEKEFQSRINFQELMEKVNVPIYLLKVGDQRPAYVNQAMCDLQGFTKEKLLTTPFHTTLHPDDLTRIMQLVERRKKGEVSDTQYPVRIRHASGKYIVINIRNREVLIDGERYILSTLLDINDFVEMEQALKSSEEKLRLTFAAMEDLVFVTDVDGVIREFYQPDHPDLYVPPGKFLNKRFEDVLPEQVAGKLQEALINTLKTNTSKSVEYELDIQNKTKTFNAKLSVIKNKADENAGVVLVIRDITEKIETEKALREREEKYNLLMK